MNWKENAVVEISHILQHALFLPFIAVVAVAGWMWNILIVLVMIQNHIPVTRKIHISSIMPFGLSLHFTGIAIGLLVEWLRLFYTPEYKTGDMEVWMSRLFYLEEYYDESTTETDQHVS